MYFLGKTHALKVALCLLVVSGAVAQADEGNKGGNHPPASLKRAAFPIVLKRLRPSPTAHTVQAPKRTRQTVFINWRRLYWGNLDGLLYRDGGKNHSRDAGYGCPDAPGAEGMVDELRHELRAFARDYHLKILWRQASKSVSRGVAEVTGAFLEYWDRGLSRESKAAVRIPLADLCRLADQSVGNKTTLNTREIP